MLDQLSENQIEKVLEVAAEEEKIEFIEKVETWDGQFYIHTPGGEEIAKRVAETLRGLPAELEEYSVELYRDPDVEEPNVRLVSDSIKEAERAVEEDLKWFYEEYHNSE